MKSLGLNSNEHIDDEYLKTLVNDYLEKCENEKLYDWRYYFIKYDEFRPDCFGKYWIKKENYYDIYVMVTSTKLSENSYQPFLKVIDSDHLDRNDYGMRLKYDDIFVYCEKNKFELKDMKDVVIKTIPISQNENGIDTENRIEKYRSSKKEFFKEI